uniref:C-type lectin domain-containing protein n=1 Tax=Syphacia muris TaxID=451379 RepID=A0A0N5AC30_9BILA
MTATPPPVTTTSTARKASTTTTGKKIGYSKTWQSTATKDHLGEFRNCHNFVGNVIRRPILLKIGDEFYCLYHFKPNKRLSFDEAELYCQKVFGGHMLSVHDNGEERFLREKLFVNSSDSSQSILLGLHAGGDRFTDGTVATYVAKETKTSDVTSSKMRSCIGLFRIVEGLQFKHRYFKVPVARHGNLKQLFSASIGECKDYKTDIFYRRTPTLVSDPSKTKKYCIYQIKLPKVFDDWFEEAELFCQRMVKGHLLSVGDREEDAFLHELLFPPFKSYREDVDAEVLGLIYSDGELHDFTDGSDDYYVALKCKELYSEWITCRRNYHEKPPIRDLSGRKNPSHKYTFSPVASCIVPYSDEYDTYAVFVDVDNKSDFYCLYDITPLKSINVSDAEFICQKDFGGHLLSVNNRYEFRFLSDYIFENHTNVVDTRIAYDLRPLGAMKFRGQTKFTDKTDANFILKRVETANTALDYQGQCYSFVRHYALRTSKFYYMLFSVCCFLSHITMSTFY